MSEIEALIGDPAQIDRELSQFRETSKMLSSKNPRMNEEYPDQWVALFDGKVQASGMSMERVLHEIDKKEIPRGRVIVRFIEKNPRTMVL